jgi:hypothetical protein
MAGSTLSAARRGSPRGEKGRLRHRPLRRPKPATRAPTAALAGSLTTRGRAAAVPWFAGVRCHPGRWELRRQIADARRRGPSPSCPGFELTVPCGGWSGCLSGAVVVEHLGGGAAAHVGAVVATPVVVADQTGVGLGLELSDAGEPAPVERWSPALLQDRGVEALAHGVVVRGPGRDPVMVQALGGEVGLEPVATYSGPLSVNTALSAKPRRR